ncbi:MAG: DUF4020 domain-containing protein [Candidatus Cloacimonetes bacterium]|nr:DUF4020 domain-containing protein [Candidatus Cloacimonadota bacterium]
MVKSEKNENEASDKYFGRIAKERKTFDLKKKIAQQLTKEGSDPNKLHKTLCRLFRDFENFRIVTTNQDKHLGTVYKSICKKKKIKCNIYQAPALPLGDDFNGLVYLHGNVDDPQKMIFTDEDFSKAYLTKGWAVRFLMEMFEKYTILFIGYGHNDVVMEYLARGLPVTTVKKRFAIAPYNPEKGESIELATNDWKNRNIELLPYNSKNGKEHADVCFTIKQWLHFVEMPTIDFEKELRAICSLTVDAKSTSDAHFAWALRDVGKTNSLFRHMPIEFYKWLQTNGYLGFLYNVAEPTTSQYQIINWLCDKVVMYDRKLLFSQHVNSNTYHLKLNRQLREAVLLYLCRNLIDDPRIYEFWIPKIFYSNLNCSDYLDIEFLRHLVKLELYECFFIVYSGFTKPRFLLKQAYQDNFLPDIEHDHYHLREELSLKTDYVSLVFKQRSSEMWSLIFSNLLQICRMTNLKNNILLSHHTRASIEPSSQMFSPTDVDFYINCVRDAMEWFTKEIPAEARYLIETLFNANYSIMKRIAIHSLRLLSTLSSQEKVEWIQERNIFQDGNLHHETYLLCHAIYPELPNKKKVVFLQYVEQEMDTATPNTEEYPHSTGYLLDFLTYLQQADSACEVLTHKINIIKNGYPVLSPQRHPEFISYIYSNMSSNVDDYNEFRAKLDPYPLDELIDLLEEKKYSQFKVDLNESFRISDGQTWQKIREIANLKSFLVLDFVKWLIRKGSVDSRIINPIMNICSESDDVGFLKSVLILSKNREMIKQHHYAISELLSTLFNRKEELSPNLKVECFRIINCLLNCLQELSLQSVFSEQSDDANNALNSTVGDLTRLLIRELDKHLRRPNIKNKKNIKDRFRKYFNKLLTEHHQKGYALVFFTANLGFMYFHFPRWTKKHILPHFLFTNYKYVKHAWAGWLWRYPINVKVFESIKELYLNAFEYLNEMPNRSRFIQSSANITISIQDIPQRMKWVKNLLQYASENDMIVFANYISEFFEFLPEEKRETHWQEWLKDYFQLRSNQHKSNRSAEESGIYFGWCQYEFSSYDELVDIVTQFEEIEQSFQLLNKLKSKKDLFYNYPNSIYRVLQHYIPRCVRFRNFDYVDGILPTLQDSKLTNEQLHELCALLHEQGYDVLKFDDKIKKRKDAGINQPQYR